MGLNRGMTARPPKLKGRVANLIAPGVRGADMPPPTADHGPTRKTRVVLPQSMYPAPPAPKGALTRGKKR
jgi:hypothetical protein